MPVPAAHRLPTGRRSVWTRPATVLVMLASLLATLAVESGVVRTGPKNVCQCEAAGRVCRCGDGTGCCGATPRRDAVAQSDAAPINNPAKNPAKKSVKKSCCGGEAAPVDARPACCQSTRPATPSVHSDCGCGDSAPISSPATPPRLVPASVALPRPTVPTVRPSCSLPVESIGHAPDPPVPRPMGCDPRIA